MFDASICKCDCQWGGHWEVAYQCGGQFAGHSISANASVLAKCVVIQFLLMQVCKCKCACYCVCNSADIFLSTDVVPVLPAITGRLLTLALVLSQIQLLLLCDIWLIGGSDW